MATREGSSSLEGQLSELLGTPSYIQRARELGQHIQAQDGVSVACDAIESVLTRR